MHPDGTAVWVFLASCLTDSANNTTPGTQTLTVAQAETIFQNSGFDFTIPASVVARGAKSIRNPTTFN